MEAEIQKWLDGHGIKTADVAWYEDYETGKTLKRESFEQLQKDIFNGKIRTVIVFKLDRLSRRLRDGVNLLADWCEQGIRIVVITQQIELNGAGPAFEAELAAVVDELDRALAALKALADG